MDVGNVGTQDYAAQAATRRESPPSTPPVGADGQGADPKGSTSVASKPGGDTVTLSGNNAPKEAQAPATQGNSAEASRNQSTDTTGQPLPALNPNLRADYTVNEGGDLVVRIIDQNSDQVVRQIPDEEQQRIREAIAKATQEQTAPEAKKAPPTNAVQEGQAPPPVLGAGQADVERAPLLGERSEKANTPSEQSIGSQTKSASSETQYAAQARTTDGQESGANRAAPATSAQEGANNFRDDGATRIETSGAVQEQRETGNTPDNGDSGAEAENEARNGTFREAAIAAQAAQRQPGQVVNVTG